MRLRALCSGGAMSPPARWGLVALLGGGLMACTPAPSMFPRADSSAPDAAMMDASSVPADAGPGRSPAEVVAGCRALELCDLECDRTRYAWANQPECVDDALCQRSVEAAYTACYDDCVVLHGSGAVEAAYTDYRGCLERFRLGRGRRDRARVDWTFQVADRLCFHGNCAEIITACHGPPEGPVASVCGPATAEQELDCAGVMGCVDGCPQCCAAQCPGGAFPPALGCRARCERACTLACEAGARDDDIRRHYRQVASCWAAHQTHCGRVIEACAAGGLPPAEGPECGDQLFEDPEGACDRYLEWVLGCFRDGEFCGVSDEGIISALDIHVRSNCRSDLAQRCTVCSFESCDDAADLVFGIDVYDPGGAPELALDCLPSSRLCRQLLPVSHGDFARTCLPCRADADCADSPTPRCDDGRCRICSTVECLANSQVCHSERGCVPCDQNAPCPGAGECVEGRCIQCDPVGQRGCRTPDRALCGETGVCEPCQADAHCRGFRNRGSPYCVDGVCQDCQPGTREGCGADPGAPVCRVGADGPECTPCERDDECGAACDEGECVACQAADDCVDPLRPVCSLESRTCRPCARDAECREAEGGALRVCLGGRCM